MFVKIHTPVLWAIQSPAHWLTLTAAVVVFFPFEWPVTVWPAYALVFDCVFATALAHVIGHTIVFLLAGLLVLNSIPRLRQYPLFYFVMMVLGSLGEEFLKLFVLNRWLAPLVSDVRSLSFDTLGFVLAYLLIWGWGRFRNARSVRKQEKDGPGQRIFAHG
jgi:hypothetical protein